MLFHYEYDKKTLIPTTLGLIVCFVFLLTPWVRLIKLRQILKTAKLLQRIESVTTEEQEDSESTQKPYESYSPDFVFDYDRENPITASEAYKQWIELINEQKGEHQAKVTQKQVFSKIDATTLNNLKDYSNKKVRSQPKFERLVPGLDLGIQELIGMEAEQIQPRIRYDIQRNKRRYAGKLRKGTKAGKKGGKKSGKKGKGKKGSVKKQPTWKY